jgi:hypothetical protein
MPNVVPACVLVSRTTIFYGGVKLHGVNLWHPHRLGRSRRVL